MASVQDVAVLAFSVAGGCSKILEPLLCFLGGHSLRSPTVDQAAVFLLVFLPVAYVAGIIISYFAGVVLAYLHPAGTAMSFADLGRFIVLLFTLVSAWLLVIAVFLAFFVFLVAGKRMIRPGFGWNVLS